MMEAMTILDELRRPVVAAPMAGGPSTPALAAAVSGAGGLGFLAAGMLTPEQMLADMAATRARTDAPFGVNVFLPGARAVDTEALRAYAARLAPVAERWGVALGDPVGGDDAAPAKLAALIDHPVAVVSFAFGLPDAQTVAALRRAGSEVWATANHPDAAVAAAELGVDAIVVQGTEAGAHRGGAYDADDYALLPLLRLSAARTGAPLVAAGGIGDGAGLAAVLAAGARAGQLGTAFLRCPEAGTSAVHRAALARGGETRLTRAFSGRRARAIVNDFLSAHEAAAPAAYPQVLHLVRPILAAARAAQDPSTVNLFAGQAHRLGREVGAAQLVEELTAQALEALAALTERSAGWRR
jgi:NAD(P)H-dependent flavin oxidoreductase YrpB (nitropropane dioxygenase family)